MQRHAGGRPSHVQRPERMRLFIHAQAAGDIHWENSPHHSAASQHEIGGRTSLRILVGCDVDDLNDDDVNQ